MKKAELQLLERVYAREIENALSGRDFPFQSKSKLAQRLCDEGYLERVDRIIPADRQCPFPIHITGWQLTLFGNFTYCMSCDAPEGLEK